MLTKDNLNETLADVVMNRPREFFIGSKRYCLWFPSLGQSLMIQRNIEALGLDFKLLQLNPPMEALRLVKLKKDEVCRILALHSFRSYAELSNSEAIERRSKSLGQSLTGEEIAQLLLVVFSFPKAEEVINLSGIREQQVEQARISKIKNADGHTVTFGGLTMFGSLIGPACEKLHLTPHQAVWEIPLIQLQLLLADSVNSVYLSEEERKQAHIRKGNAKQINAEDPANFAHILAMDWS